MSRETAKRPFSARRFALAFLALVGLGQALHYAVVVDSGAFRMHLEATAQVSAWVLAPFTDELAAQGTLLRGHGGSVEVKSGCDAVQPAIVFLAAVLATPASLPAKLTGALAGVAALFLANAGRVALLYGLATKDLGAFDLAHRTVLPVVFILLAFALWLAWAHWTSEGPEVVG